MAYIGLAIVIGRNGGDIIHVAFVGVLAASSEIPGFVCITDEDVRLALDDRKNNIQSHHSLRQNLYSTAIHHVVRVAPRKCLSLCCAHSTLDQRGTLYNWHVPLYFPGK